MRVWLRATETVCGALLACAPPRTKRSELDKHLMLPG